MGMTSKLAKVMAVLATLFFILAWITPWWFFKFDGRKDKRTNCFIDGTCRNGGVDESFKRNGDAQNIYDAVVVLMALAFVPFLVWLHYLFFQQTSRYHFLSARRLITLIAGALAFLLILAAVITFAAGIDHEYKLPNDEFYGEHKYLHPRPADAPGGDGIHRYQYEWGANAGWYFALFSLIPLLGAIILAAMIKPKPRKNVVVSEKTTTTTTTTAPTAYTTTTTAVPDQYAAPTGAQYATGATTTGYTTTGYPTSA